MEKDNTSFWLGLFLGLLSNFRAAIAQHEVDHLNGILLHTYKENIQ